MGGPAGLEKGAAPEAHTPAAFNAGGPAAHDSEAPAYPPMVPVRPTAQEAMHAFVHKRRADTRAAQGAALTLGTTPQGYPRRGSCAQPLGEFATQPPPRGHPGYAPTFGVPGNSAQAVHSSGSCGECCGDFLIRVIHNSEVFNIQWVLFVFGCFFVVPSIVAVLLELIQHGRLQKEPSYRSSWLCNVVLSVLWILAAIVIAVLVTRAQRAEQLSNSYNHG